MKTKPWSPSALLPSNDEHEVSYSVDFPCLMSGAGTPFAGPLPLALCMLQGLQLVRLGSKFEIKTEAGDRLLELRDGKLWGLPMLVDIFMRQNELAIAMFDDMYAQARETVSNGQQG